MRTAGSLPEDKAAETSSSTLSSVYVSAGGGGKNVWSYDSILSYIFMALYLISEGIYVFIVCQFSEQ
jgi:hypothetical protein